MHKTMEEVRPPPHLTQAHKMRNGQGYENSNERPTQRKRYIIIGLTRWVVERRSRREGVETLNMYGPGPRAAGEDNRI